MNIELEPGKYVVAVSGGIDSVVLLHMLMQQEQESVVRNQLSRNSTGNRVLNTEYSSRWRLVVAHFDHGIREDSAQDCQFVARLAEKQGLPFYYEEGKLGAKASEAKAREARYEFLHKICKLTESNSIITAHHQDDRIETACINMLRGTGRKGLSSLGSTQQIKRPILHLSKHAIRDYAKMHKIVWREDCTNLDNDYLRNYLRNKILPRLTAVQREKLIDNLDFATAKNVEIDKILKDLLHDVQSDTQIDREWFISLPHIAAREVLSAWLRKRGISFDRPGIERLVVGLKTLPAGAKADISNGWYFVVSSDRICLKS